MHKGKVPKTLNALTTLPGIGKNTAGAILTYAYGQPALFIETNIRSVFIHHFFPGHSDISDSEILSLLEQTMDNENPKHFYWALMDYGSFLKKENNNITMSKHYKKQSKFVGSKRQLRGQIIRLLTVSVLSKYELEKQIVDTRLKEVLNDLLKEGLVIHRHNQYRLG